jgi:GNAT superfamily N-acetyltransferase
VAHSHCLLACLGLHHRVKAESTIMRQSRHIPLPPPVLTCRWAWEDTVILLAPIGWAAASRVAVDWQWAPPSAAQAWDWSQLARTSEICAVLASDSSQPLALFASKRAVIQLNHAKYLRVDRLAVDPAPHRRGVGSRALFALAELATALHATGIVLAALPEASAFYEALGGRNFKPLGWQFERGLLPFCWDGDDFAALLEVSRAIQVAPATRSDPG